jgi:putative component of toxin-antitoxin plasmid stabilization module
MTALADVNHGSHYGMIEVRRAPEFYRWLLRLRDERAKARIALRVQRMAFGNTAP